MGYGDGERKEEGEIVSLLGQQILEGGGDPPSRPRQTKTGGSSKNSKKER